MNKSRTMRNTKSFVTVRMNTTSKTETYCMQIHPSQCPSCLTELPSLWRTRTSTHSHTAAC